MNEVSHETEDQQDLNSVDEQEPITNERSAIDNLCSGTCSMNSLKLYTQFPPDLPSLKPSRGHSILFDYNTLSDKAPLPYPKSYMDKWDDFHVRLPCSSQNICPVKNNSTGGFELHSRWEIIQGALTKPILTSTNLQEAIITYNPEQKGRWKFDLLHKLFHEHLEPEKSKDFFDNSLPKIIDLCLQTPKVCTRPIPLLKSGEEHKITLSQKQIACLLANAFLCTFPEISTHTKKSEYSFFPSINFSTLYDVVTRRPSKIEKVKCLIKYFERVTKEDPSGVVTFHRQCVKNFPKWVESQKLLTKFFVQSEGRIEVEGTGMLQIDFANKNVGGGVLKSGCVQEEIRFVICPELIISRLFTERLDKNEVLIVTGCEQYSRHTGYAETFCWDGNFEDSMPRDSWRRRLTRVVAMDALRFTRPIEQFSPECIQRELEKSYTGFLEPETTDYIPSVATGNWGCGAFRGDAHLKALIQLMSASEVGRDVLYFTFDDKELEKDLNAMYLMLKKRNVSVGQLVKMLNDYHEQVVCMKGNDQHEASSDTKVAEKEVRKKQQGKKMKEIEPLYSFLSRKLSDAEPKPLE